MWQDKVTNTEVLEQAGQHSMHLLLYKWCLQWLRPVYQMEDGHIPKDILHSQLTTGSWSVGCPLLCYKDVCKKDLKWTEIDTESWETVADDCSMWRRVIKDGLQRSKRRGICCLFRRGINGKKQQNQPCWPQRITIVISDWWMPSIIHVWKLYDSLLVVTDVNTNNQWEPFQVPSWDSTYSLFYCLFSLAATEVTAVYPVRALLSSSYWKYL